MTQLLNELVTALPLPRANLAPEAIQRVGSTLQFEWKFDMILACHGIPKKQLYIIIKTSMPHNFFYFSSLHYFSIWTRDHLNIILAIWITVNQKC